MVTRKLFAGEMVTRSPSPEKWLEEALRQRNGYKKPFGGQMATRSYYYDY